MIARGDLAVEVGFERLSEVQQEILWLCEAAHVPVIRATQILEDMAKKGSPSRAEVSAAAMSILAECAMFNKGPNIVATVRTLLTPIDSVCAVDSAPVVCGIPFQRRPRPLSDVGIPDEPDFVGGDVAGTLIDRAGIAL